MNLVLSTASILGTISAELSTLTITQFSFMSQSPSGKLAESISVVTGLDILKVLNFETLRYSPSIVHHSVSALMLREETLIHRQPCSPSIFKQISILLSLSIR